MSKDTIQVVSQAGPSLEDITTVSNLSPAYLSDGDSSSTTASTNQHGQTSSNSSTGSNSSKADLSSEGSSLAFDKREFQWSGYQEDVLPEKAQGRYSRNLRHQLFSIYRRLFSVVFITNLAIFITFIVRGTNTAHIGTVLVANLFVAILMRQDYVINAFFIVFTLIPSSWPLSLRLICARVYHIGGLHSGCAASATVWLILFAAQATKEFVTTRQVSIGTVVIAYIILVLCIGIVIFAHPYLRAKRHDSFEMSHRFAGWTATGLVWALFILLTNDYRPADESLAKAMRTSPSFWLVVILTASIALPWFRLRKVPVRAEVLSSHAVRLHFDYVHAIPGSFTRISNKPLTEWHSFATIAIPGEKGYSAVVSKAGDWTTEQIANPPTKLWVRGIPTFGVLRIVPIFRRVVIVATGSGIGPVTPHLLQRRVPIKLLWTSPNVRETFGNKFVDLVLGAAPDAVVYDTRTHGKPDMVKLTHRLYREYNAEAVLIISNPKLTYKLIYGLTSRGVPAFAPIFDS